MAEKKKDDLADALAAMMNGQGEPEEADVHDSTAGQEPQAPAASHAPAPAAAPPPARKGPPVPVASLMGAKPKPAVAPPARPAAGGSSSPAGSPRPSNVPAAAAAKPRPVAPAPVARPVAPARTRTEAPAAPAQVSAPQSQATDWVGPPPEDDDAMIAPPVPKETLGHVHRTVRRPVPAAVSLDFKRTLIPVYLTTTLCTAVAGGLHWILPESFFADMPIWFSLLMFAFALPMLFCAVFTMMQVHQQLKAHP